MATPLSNSMALVLAYSPSGSAVTAGAAPSDPATPFVNYGETAAIVNPDGIIYDLGEGMSSQFISPYNPLGRVPTAFPGQLIVSDGTGAFYVIRSENAARLLAAIRVSVGNPEISKILAEDGTIPGFSVRDPDTGTLKPWDGSVSTQMPPPGAELPPANQGNTSGGTQPGGTTQPATAVQHSGTTPTATEQSGGPAASTQRASGSGATLLFLGLILVPVLLLLLKNKLTK